MKTEPQVKITVEAHSHRESKRNTATENIEPEIKTEAPVKVVLTELNATPAYHRKVEAKAFNDGFTRSIIVIMVALLNE